MRVCDVGDASEAFLIFFEKRKKEEKGRRELKELSILHRLPRQPRKRAWLLGFKRGALAVSDATLPKTIPRSPNIKKQIATLMEV